MTVEEVMDEIKRDIPFYRRSGGGVTFSGGEPFFQFDFFRNVLEECCAVGVNTAIETTGYTTLHHFQYAMEHLDFVFMDIKHMDAAMHKKLTGVSNEVILNNLRSLRMNSKKITIRIPVVPACNDAVENIEATAHFIATIEAVKKLELLPYHNLGETKYASLGRTYSLHGVDSPDQEMMRRLQQAAEKILQPVGIPCTIVRAFDQ
jgi:pyruvate formate lyase activating enzyme